MKKLFGSMFAVTLLTAASTGMAWWDDDNFGGSWGGG